MRTTFVGRVFLACIVLLAVMPMAYAQDTAAKGDRQSAVPRLYVATGPTSEADLARLRAAIGKLAGVQKVEARAEFGAITVTIDGDGSSTQSLFAAAAKSVGFVLRPVSPRYYIATGSEVESDLSRLHMALEKVPGVEQVEMSGRTGGAGVRITGVMGYPTLTAAGKVAGYELRELASYVAAGSSAKADLDRLHAALGKTAGVEQVEMQGLIGGATLLIYGDVGEAALAAAAKPAGFALWSLGSPSGPRVFRIKSGSGTLDSEKLRQALQKLEGIGEIEIRTDSDGPQLSITGGSAQPEGILAAAAAAGFTLRPVRTVALPTLTPEADRNTPPDYDNRVLEELAVVGMPPPDFNLLSKDGGTQIRLSDYLGKKPIVLMFGSCT
ncbi:MAG TPA: hypothetical protein VKU00_13435 [Chthonomonadaceae bacterium]|nr:hypothetical protein [Chthonomonadaceae bacterium]